MVALFTELWFNAGMQKSKAIELLGGSIAAAASAIGVSYQAVDKWPEVLPDRIADRVLAVQARRHLPAELIGADNPTTNQTTEPAAAGV
jgi:hypothetical protein